MFSPVLAVAPPHGCDPYWVLAATRAGACGILDLGFRDDALRRRRALKILAESAGKNPWGVRWDTLGLPERTPGPMAELAETPWPLLLIAGVESPREDLADLLQEARGLARQVFLEVYSRDQALAAQEAGFDGVVLVGREAGGRVSVCSSFVLLNQVHRRLRIPYWVRGGLGAETAAAAFLAGATGVVLGEPLWLAEESPLKPAQKRRFAAREATDTFLVGDGAWTYRFQADAGRRVAAEIEREVVAGATWSEAVGRRLLDPSVSPAEMPFPAGQDLALADRWARNHGTLGRMLAALRHKVDDALQWVREQPLLGSESAWAKSLGPRYPLVQRPMPWISDVPAFARSVAEHGALPVVALGAHGRPEADRLLAETAAAVGAAPWGVGLANLGPERMRKQQWQAVCRARPTCVLVEHGTPEAIREFEGAGMAAYAHVHDPGQLAMLAHEGVRKFVVDGSEREGRGGPCTSFVLWQSLIDTLEDMALGDSELDNPEEVHVVLGGAIHDALSAAMAATVAGTLARHGMKIGFALGTPYLFTPEAVDHGAITAAYQRLLTQCGETTLLASGSGNALRCIKTPAVEAFGAKRRQGLLAGRRPEEIEDQLELYTLGRVRIAAKGHKRSHGGPHGELIPVEEARQHAEGLFPAGEAATFHDRVRPIARLHRAVTGDAVKLLEKRAGRKIAWSSKRSRKRPGRPLAIVGLGCLFPQSPDVRTYWQNILQRFETAREVPPERWREEDFFDADRVKKDRCYSKWGSFLDEIVFDPFRYRMPPASVRSIEPVQLLALEVARRALEDAGYGRPGFPNRRTAVVFAAAGTHDLGLGYAFRTALRHWLPRVEGLDDAARRRLLAELENRLPQWTEDSFAGFLMNVVAGRIANRFDLTGSNFTVDAACASSFAALQTAAEQLRAGKCDAALVGAVDGTNNPFCFMSFAKTYAISPSGACRPFDEKADGLHLGEGIAALVLKRLDDAQRDGDRIYAVVKGIGSSGDGPARSMTAPFPDGQILAIRRALEDAGIEPKTISLVEAHGTGTSVGDQVEVEALTKIFSESGVPPRQCAIGTVKSMIGHTKSVAGFASLIKTALAVQHKILPPTVGVSRPNAQLRDERCPVYVCTDSRPWFNGKPNVPRRAGVSAFGFGGTNFHVILEEYGEATRSARDMTPRGAELFSWTGQRREDVLAELRGLDRQLATIETDDLAQLAYAVYLDGRREETPAPDRARCRLAMVATSVEDLREKLREALEAIPSASEFDNPAGIYYSEAKPVERREVCCLFPGQGSQTVDMMKDLLLHSPWAWEMFERADVDLAAFFDQPLSRYLYPIPVFSDEERRAQAEVLNNTRLAQPALGLVEMFAYRMLRRFGVEPAVVAGHSYGECVALAAAGVYSTEDLLRLSALRGQAVHEAGKINPGAMASVFGSAEATTAALKELNLDARLANLNADVQTVIAGPVAAIEAAVVELPKKGLRTKRIRVTAAFHTPSLQGVREIMDRHMAEMDFHEPRIPIYSNTTARYYPTQALEIRRRLGRQTTEPVRFAELVNNAHADGVRVFIEVGPGGVLSGLARRNLKDKPFVVLPMDAAGRNGWLQLGHVLAKLAALGLPVQGEAWFEERRLAPETVADFIQSEKARTERKPTDWLVGPGGARPWTDATKPRAAAASSALTAPAPERASPENAKEPILGTAVTAAADFHGPQPCVVQPACSAPSRSPFSREGVPPDSSQLPSFTLEPPSGAKPTPEPTTMERQHVTETTCTVSSNGNGSSHVDLIGQFQYAMVQWLEMQKTQQQVNQQFLDTQQAVMLACFQGPTAPAAQVARRLAHVAPPVAPPPQPKLRVAPAPVVPAGSSLGVMSQTEAAPVRPAATGSSRPAPPPSVSPPAVPAPSPVPEPAPETQETPVARVEPPEKVARMEPPERVPENAPAAPPSETAAAKILDENGAPPLETFRRDLLQAIADRTGYPIDMLDEKLELEAGLGIDSIKTIEIFGMLTKYHAYLPGASEDQEESLAAFAQLRTIRDILDTYQLNLDENRQNGNGESRAPGERETEAATSGVERATLEAVETPPSPDRQKKNSLAATFS